MLLLSCLQVEIYVFPDWMPPSWISDFQLRRTVLPIVPLDSLPPKTWGSRWNFVPIMSMSWDLGGGNHPPRHFTCFYTDTLAINIFFKFLHRQMRKWVAQRCTEAFLKYSCIKHMAFEKHRGVVTAPSVFRWLKCKIVRTCDFFHS